MKVCLVCSHGGHLTELLELQTVWDEHDTFFITYESARNMPSRAYRFQNLADGKLRVIPMFFRVLKILWTERPDWIVSDGAEIAIPVFFAAKLLMINTLFIESLCRVHTPSFTGRVLYPFSDVFLVQWPSLLKRYGPKARYEGGVI